MFYKCFSPRSPKIFFLVFDSKRKLYIRNLHQWLISKLVTFFILLKFFSRPSILLEKPTLFFSFDPTLLLYYPYPFYCYLSHLLTICQRYHGPTLSTLFDLIFTFLFFISGGTSQLCQFYSLFFPFISILFNYFLLTSPILFYHVISLPSSVTLFIDTFPIS